MTTLLEAAMALILLVGLARGLSLLARMVQELRR